MFLRHDICHCKSRILSGVSLRWVWKLFYWSLRLILNISPSLRSPGIFQFPDQQLQPLNVDNFLTYWLCRHFGESGVRFSTHHDTVGVKRNASKAEIKSAYKLKTRTCHPDLFPGNDAKAKEFLELQEAYSSIVKQDKFKSHLDTILDQRQNESYEYEDKPLTEEEKVSFKRTSKFVALVYIIVIINMYGVFKLCSWPWPSCSGVTLKHFKTAPRPGSVWIQKVLTQG